MLTISHIIFDTSLPPSLRISKHDPIHMQSKEPLNSNSTSKMSFVFALNSKPIFRTLGQASIISYIMRRHPNSGRSGMLFTSQALSSFCNLSALNNLMKLKGWAVGSKHGRLFVPCPLHPPFLVGKTSAGMIFSEFQRVNLNSC